MALTSPDNIWTPDSSDNYALTTDLAATADTVQDALTKRANYGLGTTAEMNAAVNDFPNGAMWFNTTNDTEYRRVSGAWVAQGEDTGVFAVPGSGPAGWNQNSTARIKNGFVTLDINLVAASGRPAGTIESIIPADPRWAQTMNNNFRFVLSATGETSLSARIFNNGNTNVYGVPAISTGGSIYGTVTYPVG